MPRGGARVNSGPPPDPNALRRDRPTDAQQWIMLPAEGRRGEPPAWPFVTISDREADLWASLWATPHAVEWERLGWRHEVALYARIMTEAEVGIMSAATEARQWSDRLGLNPAAMLRNRWRVGAASEAAPKAAPKKRTTAGSRARLRAVPDA